MFDNTPNDLYSTLLEMDLRARERCRFDQIAAKEKMKGWIAHDQRFGTSMQTALSKACKRLVVVAGNST